MARRFKLVLLAALAFTIATMLYTSRLRDARTPDQRTIQDFYHKTKGALTPGSGGVGGAADKAAAAKVIDMDNDGDVDEDDARLAREMQSRLKAAEQQAKDNANAKAPNRPDAPGSVIGVGSSANGQKAAGGAAGAGAGAGAGAPAQGAGGAPAPAAAGAAAAPGAAPGAASGAAPGADEAATELASILRRAPVVIFSKTYCPFSKRAKGVLLDKYVIEPAPVVVELDTHPLGPQLQAHLAERTGRRTVPNILVDGTSIGGGDDVAALDASKQLLDKVTTLGAKSGVLMKERLG
ncbi:glutaredoxin domain containing protein [Sporothrix schenckii 1099-18]|uniref:Glutaredoxin n=2 Tax=Sporothrix schenckii TaxID=29908 RepID=U7PND1_SPOS1|nr:glutaredoxin domain containing protein [Sporothrix schenckii 1099-18]ERS96000.1 glutaredoxin [Sporothrix schenckii ATCC 58251]KJR81744.1 glutaredoxin domain containing protein [Sporothrix schenckii 1099-18]